MRNDKFSLSGFFNRKEPQLVIKGVRVTSSVFWNLFLIFAVLGLVTMFFVGGAAAGYFASLVQDEPIRSFEDMEQDIYDYEEATEIYFTDDIYLGDLPSPLERREVPLEDISEYLIDAVIATEDEYFFDHDGIVPKALFRALYQDFANTGTQTGGSTLTQQLIKNQILTSEVTHDRKAVEILLAMRTEKFFEKEEILEAYLNVVPFGRNANGRQIAGAQAAAQGVFGVEASELNLPQAAFIAGLPQSPFAYTPFAGRGEVKEDFEAGLNRMNTVLNRMHSRGYISDEELGEAQNYDVRDNLAEPQPTSLDNYPYITDEIRIRAREKLVPVLMEEDDIDLDEIEDEGQRELFLNRYNEEAERTLQRNGYKIFTTIDKEIYDAQQEVVADFEYFDADRTVTAEEEGEEGENGEEVEVTHMELPGSVLIDNSSGAIISFVAGRDYEHRSFNQATRDIRSTGSTMKPLLTYAIGFETGVLQPGFITPDTPYYDYFDDPDRALSNFDGQYRGFMTAREAHAASRNVPAVREFDKVDHDIAREALINYGFEHRLQDDEPYQSTPLGTVHLTVEENTSAFSTFANEGKRKDSYMIERIETADGEVVYEHEEDEVEIISPQTNYLMIDIMRDVLESGGTAPQLPNFLNFDADWLGKTGTSNLFVDSWFVGVNPNVTQGLWLGYPHGDSITQELDGLSYGPRTQMLWADLANAAYEINPDLMAPSERFESPGGIVRQSICGISGKLPTDLCREAGLVTTDLFNRDYVPTEEDDSLQRVQYVKVNGGLYKALDETPSEFTRSGVSVKEEYFDFEEEDLTEYLPDDWDDLVPDREAPDNGSTPESLQSLSASGSSVSWDEHHEGDVIGYRVYYSSDGDESFSEVSSVRWDEDFSYSGSSGVYYVTAVDVAGRESSSGDRVTLGSISDDDDEEDESDSDSSGESTEPDDDEDQDSSNGNNDENDNENNDNNDDNNNDSNNDDNNDNNNNDDNNDDDNNDNNNNDGNNDNENNDDNNNNDDDNNNNNSSSRSNNRNNNDNNGED